MRLKTQRDTKMGYQLITDNGLRERLERCLKHQNSLNEYAPGIAASFADKSNPEIPGALKEIMNDLTGVLGLCQLAGVTPETILQGWVELKERKFPELRLPPPA